MWRARLGEYGVDFTVAHSALTLAHFLTAVTFSASASSAPACLAPPRALPLDQERPMAFSGTSAARQSRFGRDWSALLLLLHWGKSSRRTNLKKRSRRRAGRSRSRRSLRRRG